MKNKKMAGILVLSSLIVIIVTALIAHTLFTPQHYREINGKVSATYTDGDLYIFTDDGNGWNLSKTDIEDQVNWQKLKAGTNVKIGFSTMGTVDIYDDEIIDIKIVE